MMVFIRRLGLQKSQDGTAVPDVIEGWDAIYEFLGNGSKTTAVNPWTAIFLLPHYQLWEM